MTAITEGVLFYIIEADLNEAYMIFSAPLHNHGQTSEEFEAVDHNSKRNCCSSLTVEFMTQPDTSPK